MFDKLSVIGFELKYVFRQKFLIVMILISVFIIAYRMPRFSYELDYDIFLESYSEEKTDAEKRIIKYWNEKKNEIEKERKDLVEKAEEYKTELKDSMIFEKKYLNTIIKRYGNILNLEVQDYLGWEIFFAHQTDMQPHNPVSLSTIIIIVCAGLLLLTKDNENGTLFWAARTGKGGIFSSFMLKIIAIFIYGMLLQIFFTVIYLGWLSFGVGLDMRHWFNLIQNISQYAICDIKINFLEVIVIDMFMKTFMSIAIFLIVFMFSVIFKRYLFLFLTAIATCIFLYYTFYFINGMENYNFGWRMHPLSILKLDRILTYDAVNIFNQAIDIRVIISLMWIVLIITIIVCSYRLWRRYLYEVSI